MAALFRAYTRLLNEKPLITTSMSSAVCYFAGDILAQRIEISQQKRTKFDFHRTSVMTVFALTTAGPLYCMWFQKIHHINKIFDVFVKWNYERQLAGKLRNTFSKHIRDGKIEDMSMKKFIEINRNQFNQLNNEIVFRSKTILAGQVYADQFIFSAIYPVIFMMGTGLLIDNTKRDESGKIISVDKFKKSLNNNWNKVKDKYLTIYMTDCAVWPLIQIGNFAFIPAIYQPIFVNFINIFWNAFICYVSQGH